MTEEVKVELPLLPDGEMDRLGGFTEAQMRSYATAAVLAERDARRSPQPLTTLTAEQVALWARKAGGIVHSDGNMFFTNYEQFMDAAWACLQVQNPDLWCRQCAAAIRKP